MQGLDDGLRRGMKDVVRTADSIAGTLADELDLGATWNVAVEESGLPELPKTVLEANGNQFMEDLGFSGRGAIPQLLKQGAKIVYNVNSVEEALALERSRQNRERLGYGGR